MKSVPNKRMVGSVPAPKSVPDPVTNTPTGSKLAQKHPEPAPDIPEPTPVVSKPVDIASSSDAVASDLDMTMDRNDKVTSWLSKQSGNILANPHPKPQIVKNKTTPAVSIFKSQPATALSGTSAAKSSAPLVKPRPRAGPSMAPPGPSGSKARVNARTLRMLANAKMNKPSQKQMTDDEISSILDNFNPTQIFQDIFTTPTRKRKRIV